MTVVLREEPVIPKVQYEFPRSVLIIGGFVIAVVVALFSCAFAFLYLHSHHGAGRVLANIVPMPAAIVDDRMVWYREISETANILEADAGLHENEAIDRALILAIRANVMETLAVDLSVEQVDDTLVFLRHLESAVLASDVYQSDARGRLERIVTKLAEGLPFYDVATQYSDHASSANAGDLGYIDSATLPPDIQAGLEQVMVGAVSDILETEKSFWLYLVEDRLVDEAGRTTTWLRVIEIKKDLLGTVVDAQLSQADVRVFLR